jgi:transposase
VLLSDSGWSYRQISEALFLDEETISKHVDEYVTQRKLSIQSGGSKSKLSDEQESALAEHLESKTYLKVVEICDYVVQTYGVHYTVSGMTNWLKRKIRSLYMTCFESALVSAMSSLTFEQKYGIVNALSKQLVYN